MPKKKLLRNCALTVLMFFMGLTTMAQLSVKGTVTSQSDSEPLIGVSILEKGTGNGTVTDIDGNFSLKVKSEKSELVFSYVGYANKTLKATASMTVLMSEDAQSLDELVVTGYTTQRKADLTGAVSVVKMDDIAKQGENNPIKAMQGRIPGMNISADGNPSGTATVRIRGIGTLNDNDPLYIIDGVATKSGMHELNGNDIESIQVLKDAASASIYGSRAANGVIIITTKRGKEGKIRIDFDASISMSMYQSKMKVLNTQQYGQAMWQAYVNDGEDPNGNALGYNYNWGYNSNGYPVLYGMTINKYLDSAGTMAASDTDWFNEITRKGIVQQYNVAVSNGGKKGSTFFSLGYYKNLGILKDTDFDRFSARFNADYKLINDVLTVGENFTLNRTSEVQAPSGILETALDIPSAIPVKSESDGWGGPVGAWPDRRNPRAILSDNKDNRYTYWRAFGDAYINLKLFKTFNLRSTFGIDYSNKNQRFFTYPYSEGYLTNDNKSAVEAKQENWTRWMWNLVASYQLEVGKHHGDIMAGVELNRETYNYFSGYKEGFAILDPDYMWPDAGSGEAQAYGGASGYSLASFFGKINYNYDNRYLLSLTVRNDGSSRFGANNRYAIFPSVSVGWRLSQEAFMKDINWLSDLKLRASWGQTGNQEISNTALYTIYAPNYGNTDSFGGQSYGTAYDIFGTNGGSILSSGFRRQQIGNDDIKWETTTQTNIGLDFGFFGNELYGSAEYYFKSTKDILTSMAGIGVLGEGGNRWINAGSMKNRGFEINLGYRHKTAFGLNYDLTGNISSYCNEVTYLPETVAANGSFGGNGVKSVVGHAIYSQVGYIADGIFKSQDEVDNHATQEGAAVGRIRYRDIDNNGIINEKDQDWIYDPTPAFSYGLNVYLEYKNFDFTMFWQGVADVDVISDVKKKSDFWSAANVGFLNKGDRVLNAWSYTNQDSNIPSLTRSDSNNEQRVSTYYVENGSFLKLRNLQIGYSLPEKLTKAMYMQKFRLYVSAQNLLTIKHPSFTGEDPENANYGYPIPMNLTFGLNISF